MKIFIFHNFKNFCRLHGRVFVMNSPWAPNNLLKPGAKEKHQLNPVDQATDKKPRPKPTKMNSFMSGPS